jgi:hypothetical protein
LRAGIQFPIEHEALDKFITNLNPEQTLIMRQVVASYLPKVE